MPPAIWLIYSYTKWLIFLIIFANANNMELCTANRHMFDLLKTLRVICIDFFFFRRCRVCVCLPTSVSASKSFVNTFKTCTCSFALASCVVCTKCGDSNFQLSVCSVFKEHACIILNDWKCRCPCFLACVRAYRATAAIFGAIPLTHARTSHIHMRQAEPL